MSANLIQLQGGVKGYGSKELFLDATFSINEDEHVGVIGPNGAGKTTLFKILVGTEELDQGKIIKSKSLRLAYLSQHGVWETDETGLQVIEKNAVLPLWELLPKAPELGLTEANLMVPILSLSGGYRMRIKLLALLGQDPNMLMLDEPTNYLDLETTLLLERFLQNFTGAFLLISHDREFLRRTTDHTLEIESCEITKYNGNIDDYFEQKELLSSQLAARAMSQEKKRNEVLEFVARFGAKATKAKQAQSRLKQLSKMETIETRPLPRMATVRIPPPHATGKQCLDLVNVSLGYGKKTILKGVNVQINRGDHVAVVGLNGAGKSTLLKGLSGTLVPGVGEIKWGYNVSAAFFAQHVAEDLKPEHTVFQALSEGTDVSVRQQDILDLAGSLLFSGSDVQKNISVLSGGEKSRVALGRVLLKRAPLLVLDEPTNHLDFQTVEALTVALQSYAGTVIVVSHDRGFIRRIGTKILEVSQGGVRIYPGSYEEYVFHLSQRVFDEASESPEPKPIKKSSPVLEETPKEKVEFPSVPRQDRRETERRIRKLTSDSAKIEKEMDQLRVTVIELNSKLASASSVEGADLKALADAQSRLERLEDRWLENSTELEKLK